MTRPPRILVSLSRAELDIIACALWHWEDCYRTGRSQKKAAGLDVSEYDRRIADVRNIKARMFRAKPKAKV